MVDSQNICLPPHITPDVIEAASILMMMKKGLRSFLLEARQARGQLSYLDFASLPPGSAQFHYFPSHRLPFPSSLYDISPMTAAYHFPLAHAPPCSLPQPVAYYGMLATPPCFVGPPREKTAPCVPTTEAGGESESFQPAAKKSCLSSTSTSSPEVATPERPESRRKRKNLTKEQLEILEGVYAEEKYPHIEERLKLEKSTRLTEDRIQVWFQNRRAKDRKRLEAEKLQCYFETCQKKTKKQERNNAGTETSASGSPEEGQSPKRQNSVSDNNENGADDLSLSESQ